MMTNLIAALRLLTILPIPGREYKLSADALSWFPTVGLLLGAIQFFFLNLLLKLGTPTLAAAAITLALQVLLTRGFHLDGVADAADGLGGGYTKERALEIMKDSSVGAFGSMAIGLTLLIKWSLIASLIDHGLASGILLAALYSRAAIVFQSLLWPYARPSGTAAIMVQKASSQHLLIATATALLIGLCFIGFKAISLLGMVYGVTWLWGAYCKRRVGGITGDLLGATNEIAEMTACLALLWMVG
jgi:adenosylcobinamide-GDP ribazoletransferase